MSHVPKQWAVIYTLFLLLVPGLMLHAQSHGRGGCQEGSAGPKGAQMRHGMGKNAVHQADQDLFHFLLNQRAQITRTVSNVPQGVETLTESEDPAIAGKIREHVRSMYIRLEENRPIHLRDPLFAELFRHADKIEMKVEATDKGVRITETSTDPHVAELIRAHAGVVSLFLENGHAEVRKDHPVPLPLE